MTRIERVEVIRKQMGAGVKFYCKELKKFLFVVKTGRKDKNGRELCHILNEEGKFFLSDIPMSDSISELVRYANAKARKIK